MTTLHALEHHVVARLHGKMQVRHQTLLLGNGAHQLLVGLNLVDGRQSQALQLGHEAQDLANQCAERWRAGQVGAV